MGNFEFVRLAAATPSVRVADCDYNTDRIMELTGEALEKKVAAVVFPEMSVTGYTCGDLFHHELLLSETEKSVKRLCEFLSDKPIVVIINIPLAVVSGLYNVAAVLAGGKIWGFVPKTYLPNYNEYYEMRWFAGADQLSEQSVRYAGQEVPVGTSLIFETGDMRFGVEICEDLWAAVPPSGFLALHGADVIFNPSASNEVVGKHAYRRMLVGQQSARCIAGYVYTSAGSSESTTDLVFSGSRLIAENGTVLSESGLFGRGNQITLGDVDIQRLRRDRMHNTSFTSSGLRTDNFIPRFVRIDGDFPVVEKLQRRVEATPFVPSEREKLNEYCSEIFSIQTNGLAKRMEHTGAPCAVIGISGGLDSTLALLVAVKTFDILGRDRKGIVGITMPGFGTTGRTYGNAIELMGALGVTIEDIPIEKAVLQHFEDLKHDADNHDVTYENSQARERTQILMDYANKVNGLVVGTGDLSELALGWCTYNGDHMSMYGVNAGVPKTLVKALTQWFAHVEADEQVAAILHDVLDTPVSPELLPATSDGSIAQKTEDHVGPYILHDFFLYYVLRFGFSPAKIFFLAKHAFGERYEENEILKWLRVFFRRFFSQQFKRSCLPDGPKVGSVNLSPRGDWRMPSDASAAMWMKELDGLQ